jgi:hypothetical protein
MADFALNPITGDLASNGCVHDVQEIKQLIEIRLRFWTNSWFLDANEGIDYFSVFAVQNVGRRKTALTNSVRASLLQIPGISSVENIEITENTKTRTMTMRVDLRTIDLQTITTTVQL